MKEARPRNISVGRFKMFSNDWKASSFVKHFGNTRLKFENLTPKLLPCLPAQKHSSSWKKVPRTLAFSSHLLESLTCRQLHFRRFTIWKLSAEKLSGK